MQQSPWASFLEGCDYVGNMIIDQLGGWLDAATSKVTEMAGNMGSSISNNVAAMKSSISDAVTPNAIAAPKGDPSPAQSPQLSQSVEVSSTPVNDYSDIMKSAGLDTGAFSFEVTDLGGATYGDATVGCAAPDAPRAMQTHSLHR